MRIYAKKAGRRVVPFLSFFKKSLFDERLELGGSFMFRNTSSSHASLDAGLLLFQ